MAMVWAEIVLHKNVNWSTVAGLNVAVLDRSNDFIPTSWLGPSDCMPLWSNRTYTEMSEVQDEESTPPRGYGGQTQNPQDTPPRGYEGQTEHQQDTPPRGYGGHTADNYNRGNNRGMAPVSFGIGSGGYYPGSNQYGTGTTTPETYRAEHPRDTYHSRAQYDTSPNAGGRYMPTYPRDTYESGGRYGGRSAPESYTPTYPRESNDVPGQYGRGTSTPEYHTPTHPRDTYESRGQYGRGPNVPERYPTTYPTGSYDAHNQYGRRHEVPDSFRPTYPRDTYDHHGQYSRAITNPEYRTPSQARDEYEPNWNYPSKDREEHITHYPHPGYGQNAYGSNDTPPPPFRTREEEDAEFERQLREATIQSQAEYIRKLEDDRIYDEQRLYDAYSRGRFSNQAGPSGTHDDSD